MADDDHGKCIAALPKVAQLFTERPKVDELTCGELLPLDPVAGKVMSRDSECTRFQRCQNLTHKLAWQAREEGLDIDADPAILKMLVPLMERMGAAELFCGELGKTKPDPPLVAEETAHRVFFGLPRKESRSI